MGALTVNRNRGNDYFKSPAPTSPSFDLSYAHVSKKLKLSNSMIGNTVDYGRPISAKSVNSRISEYPDSKPRFMREVHAPVRSHRFGVSASKNKIVSSLSLEENSEVRMGSMYGTLKYRLEKAKISAMKTFRYVGKENESVEKEKEKEVIEIDDKKESQDDMSEDLSVQEVEVVDSPRIKWKEGNGVLGNSRELKGKMVESNLQSLGSCVVSDTSGVNVKVDSTENMMDLVLMNQEADLSGVPVHRKLYDSAKKRNDKLESLSFAIELEEKSFQRLQLFRPQKKVEETNKVTFFEITSLGMCYSCANPPDYTHVSKECFMPITMEEEAEVANALSNSCRRKVLVSHKNSNIDITGEILQCLKPGAWLNDE
ncbi:ubiquitin-like-specific protease ESD4, partial [Olea europaea var. sylvestris]|uniref:ubiquitin-like-specific protease ESD4 n=1 Tax=Olea europaea var. sylvestris TaxID=158386 RepID=UPI000C1D86E0